MMEIVKKSYVKILPFFDAQKFYIVCNFIYIIQYGDFYPVFKGKKRDFPIYVIYIT